MVVPYMTIEPYHNQEIYIDTIHLSYLDFTYFTCTHLWVPRVLFLIATLFFPWKHAQLGDTYPQTRFSSDQWPQQHFLIQESIFKQILWLNHYYATGPLL